MKRLIVILCMAAIVAATAQTKPSLINISNHPLASNITRKVEPIGYSHFWNGTNIKVYVLVHHYKNDTLVNTATIKSYEEVLQATYSSDRMVDVDGMTLTKVNDSTYVRPNGTPPTGTPVKQYDFFNALILGGPVNIPTLIQSVVLQEDQIHKRFNR